MDTSKMTSQDRRKIVADLKKYRVGDVIDIETGVSRFKVKVLSPYSRRLDCQIVGKIDYFQITTSDIGNGIVAILNKV